jgi:hypothetical protein
MCWVEDFSVHNNTFVVLAMFTLDGYAFLYVPFSLLMTTLHVVCGDPGLPSGIPVMHTIHDPRKTVMNPHNRAGITEYIIH